MKLQMEIDGQSRQIEIEPGSAGHWLVRMDGEPVEANACLIRPGVLSLILGGQSHRIVLDPDISEPILHIGSRRIPYRIDDPRSFRSRRRHGGTAGPVTLKASMPGRVVRVLVAKGDAIAAHQAVLVIEAMKMQNELKSPRDGKIAEIRVSPGETVASGDILAVIE